MKIYDYMLYYILYWETTEEEEHNSITAQIFKDKLNIKIMKSFLKEYSYFK